MKSSRLWALAVPVLAQAQTQTNNPLSNAPGIDLRIQDVYGIVYGLACWASRFIIVIMVVLLILYGLRMMLAQDNENKFKEARKSLNYAIIGIVVIMGAYTIIATVANGVQTLQAGSPEKLQQWTMFVPIQCGSYGY